MSLVDLMNDLSYLIPGALNEEPAVGNVLGEIDPQALDSKRDPYYRKAAYAAGLFHGPRVAKETLDMFWESEDEKLKKRQQKLDIALKERQLQMMSDDDLEDILNQGDWTNMGPEAATANIVSRKIPHSPALRIFDQSLKRPHNSFLGTLFKSSEALGGLHGITRRGPAGIAGKLFGL